MDVKFKSQTEKWIILGGSVEVVEVLIWLGLWVLLRLGVFFLLLELGFVSCLVFTLLSEWLLVYCLAWNYFSLNLLYLIIVFTFTFTIQTRISITFPLYMTDYLRIHWMVGRQFLVLLVLIRFVGLWRSTLVKLRHVVIQVYLKSYLVVFWYLLLWWTSH